MQIKAIKKFFTVIIFLMLVAGAYSQRLSQVTFSDAANLSYLSLITDQGVLIRITNDGKLLEFGTELQSLRSNNYYDPKLQPYLGRIDYYGSESDSAFRGKVKNIGTCAVTYYSHYDEATKVKKSQIFI